MLDRWTAPLLRADRVTAWDVLSRNSTLSVKYSVLGLFDASQSREKACFTNVCHFISDLKKIQDSKLIDDDLARMLFHDSIYPWFKFISQMKFDKDQSDGSKYEKNTKDWYERHVMAFHTFFEPKTQT